MENFNKALNELLNNAFYEGSISQYSDAPIKVYDSFYEVNNTPIENHIPNINPLGNMWENVSGNINVYGNSANWSQNGVGNYSLSVIDCGFSDCTISAILTASSNSSLAFRALNDVSYLLVHLCPNSVNLIKRDGSNTLLKNSPANINYDGSKYFIEVILLGNNMKIFVDGNFVMEYETSFNSQIKKHGIYAEGEAGFKEFQVLV